LKPLGYLSNSNPAASGTFQGVGSVPGGSAQCNNEDIKADRMVKKILILGSSNMDLVLRIPRFHRPGETIMSQDLVIVFGGKGANQAIAAKRLGGKVSFITKLGKDHYGQSYRRYLMKEGLDQKGLLEHKKLPTGMALIEVNPKGENRIIVFPGANGSISAGDIGSLSRFWKGMMVFGTQLEIPVPAVSAGLKMAKDHGALTLLNPSPPVRLTPDILSSVDFLVPNELEAQFLTGMKMKRDRDVPEMAERLLEKGVKNVVMTLGSRGLFFKSGSEEIRMDAFRVNAIDTTGAGDAFMGALACALSEGKSIREALRFANGAGALAATRLGAQPSLPLRKDLQAFLDQRDR
jgi:ribokinase